METIDANEYLIQFLGSIDNLPSEINYHFTELSNKEREIDDLTRRIERRKKRLWCLYDGVPFEEDSDCSVVESIYEEQGDGDEIDDDDSEDDCYDDDNDIELISSKRKKHRITRVITEFEDEEMLKEKIFKDLDRIALLQDEKIEISGKALALVERHIKRLDEDFDSLFPHQNLRDSSTTIPTSPGRLESPIKSLQIITQHANIVNSQANNRSIHQSNTSTSPPPPTSPLSSSSSISNSTYEYNKNILYPSTSMETEEGQFTLPLLPNPSNSTSRIGRDSLTRRNISVSSNQNSLRRRRQQNQNSASIYASNGDSTNTTSTASNNNNNFPRSIKIRYSGDPNNNNNINHLNSTSISSDRNIGLGNTNNLNLNSQAYDSPFISTDGIAFSSNFIQSDPNEPLYCTCRQVSFGEMIACDGENCPIEWYHLECVNLKAVPEGRWYCDQCIGTQKKRKRGRPVGSKKTTGLDTYDVGFASPTTFSAPTTPSHSYHGTKTLSSSSSSVLQSMNKFSLASRANKMPRISKSPQTNKY